MSEEFYIQIGSMLSFLVVQYLKTKADHKVTRKKSAESHKYLTSKLNSLDLMVRTDISKRDFKKDLANRLSLISLNIISANADLKKDYVNILSVINENVTDFAIKYHSSTYREDKSIIKNYLNIEIDSVREKNRHAVNDIVANSKNGFHLMEFIRHNNPELEVQINTLRQRLYENGLENEQYIKLFESFTKTIFTYIIKGLRKWNRT